MVGKILIVVFILCGSAFAVNPSKICEEKYDKMFAENKNLDKAYNSKDLDTMEKQLIIVLNYSKIAKDVCEVGTIENAFADYIIVETEDGLRDVAFVRKTKGQISEKEYLDYTNSIKYLKFIW